MSILKSIAADREQSKTKADAYLWQAIADDNIDANRVVAMCEVAGWSIAEFDKRHASVEAYRNAVLAKEAEAEKLARIAENNAELRDIERAHKTAVANYHAACDRIELGNSRLRKETDGAQRDLAAALANVAMPQDLSAEIADLRHESQRLANESFDARLEAMALSREVRLLGQRLDGQRMPDGADIDRLADIKAAQQAKKDDERSKQAASEAATQQADDLLADYLQTLTIAES